jgi:hypothetical protein
MPRPPDLFAAFDQDLVAYARAGHMEAYDDAALSYETVNGWLRR